jgi:putative aldouronate transport system substrate-binding protein
MEKQKFLRKILSMAVIISLIVSLFGVLVFNTDGVKATNKPTLRVIVVTHPLTQDVTKMPHLKKMADAAGVTIKWEQYRANFYEKKQTVLASGDVPDIFISGWWGTITSEDFVKYKGLYQTLDELIPKYAPNVQKMFKEHPELKVLATEPDGHIYALPKYQRFWPKNMIRMMINKVWLDKLGLKVPTTWDELYNVLKAFKTKDPNGNGKADEIPMDWAPGRGGFNVTVLLSGYGIVASFGDGSGWWVDNGKVKNYFTDPRYKELVTFLNKCYKEKLINPEVFTQDYTKFQALGRGTDKVPLVGFTFGWEPYDRFGPKWAPQYITIPPLKPNKNYKGPMYWDFNYFGLNYGANYIAMTSKCKYKAQAMKFMDQFYNPENGLQILFGPIGDNIKKNPDGSYTILPPKDPNMDPGTWKWTTTLADAGPMYISDTMKVTLGSDMQALAKYDQVYKPYLDKINVNKQIWPGVFIKFSQADLNEMSLLWTNIDNILWSYYSNWISKGGVEKGWQQYLKQLEKAGLPRYTQIMQKAYDEFMKKYPNILKVR